MAYNLSSDEVNELQEIVDSGELTPEEEKQARVTIEASKRYAAATDLQQTAANDKKDVVKEAGAFLNTPVRGYEAMGVGLADLLAGRGGEESVMRAVEATKPGFEPQGKVETVGKFAGGVAPFVALGAASKAPQAVKMGLRQGPRLLSAAAEAINTKTGLKVAPKLVEGALTGIGEAAGAGATSAVSQMERKGEVSPGETAVAAAAPSVVRGGAKLAAGTVSAVKHALTSLATGFGLAQKAPKVAEELAQDATLIAQYGTPEKFTAKAKSIADKVLKAKKGVEDNLNKVRSEYGLGKTRLDIAQELGTKGNSITQAEVKTALSLLKKTDPTTLTKQQIGRYYQMADQLDNFSKLSERSPSAVTGLAQAGKATDKVTQARAAAAEIRAFLKQSPEAQNLVTANDAYHTLRQRLDTLGGKIETPEDTKKFLEQLLQQGDDVTGDLEKAKTSLEALIGKKAVAEGRRAAAGFKGREPSGGGTTGLVAAPGAGIQKAAGSENIASILRLAELGDRAAQAVAKPFVKLPATAYGKLSDILAARQNREKK